MITLTGDKLQSLLGIMLNEVIENDTMRQKESICKTICHDLCRGEINPNEVDFAKTRIVCEDKERYFVSMRMKKGFDVTVPIAKTQPCVKKLSRRLFN